MDVHFDAYTGQFYSDLVPLATVRASSAPWRPIWVRPLPHSLASSYRPPRDRPSASSAAVRSSTSRRFSRSRRPPDQTTFDADLKTLPGDAFSSSEDALRAALGLPAYARQSWFGPQPQGKLVYRDRLAHPIGMTKLAREPA